MKIYIDLGFVNDKMISIYLKPSDNEDNDKYFYYSTDSKILYSIKDVFYESNIYKNKLFKLLEL